MKINYDSGFASLFSCLGRGEKDEEPVIVECTGCGSDDTKHADLEFDLYECTNCGAVFTRQPQGA